ncbi:DUF2939 domain-containing protein [Rufibacter roseus]|uniref:DUF2939 domain-containing protein n=1 Tax=Rufibacter roseus TaxID=1567108 RepID=A0ABW2DIC0_9BACT|nr:DUF2939 domain-containing protein [Rufibacter roseus]
MKKLVIWLVVLTALGVTGYLLYQRYGQGPEYSLYQIHKAIDNRDMAALEKYVDVERTTASLLDQTVQAGMAELPEEQRNMAALLLGMAIASQKDEVLQALRLEIERYVEQGKTGGPPAGMSPEDWEDVQALLPLDRLLQESQLLNSRIDGISYVNTQDSLAVVGLNLLTPAQKDPIVVELQMRNRQTHWQVIGLPNAGQVLKKLGVLDVWRQSQTMPQLRM